MTQLALVLACAGLVFVFFSQNDDQPFAKTRNVLFADRSSAAPTAERGKNAAIRSAVNAASQPAVNTQSIRMFSAEWVMDKDANHYLIQVRSSTDKGAIYESALDFANYHPSVVFPFKKNRNGQTVYGLATGTYKNIDEAESAADSLPVDVTEHGVWIRRVGALQKQITQISQSG